jgi:lysine-N-methylase
MIFRYPAYYDEFSCVADRCNDSCCAGWEIDIDDESYQYYMNIPGEFGDRLRKSIKEYKDGENEYESHGFILDEQQRCPFLDASGLCELYRELGEKALCDVCTYTPRNRMEYGGEREIAISASCPEAGRLIYKNSEPVTFVEREISEETDFYESEEEMRFAHEIRKARDTAIHILQKRELDICDRIAVFLEYAQAVQELINQDGEKELSQIAIPREVRRKRGNTEEAEKKYEFFVQRMFTFSNLESVREDWLAMLVSLQTRYVEMKNSEERYLLERKKWKRYVKTSQIEYQYEHLLVYYAFMCLPRCVDDYDFLGKAKLCVVSFLMIRDMDMVRYHTKGSYAMDDRLEITRIYAKEVEHSEENLNRLAEDFLFEDTYTVENILYVL